MSTLFQLIVAGLAFGCVYTLVALGYNFIMNAVGIVNLAQGTYVMIGALMYAATFTITLKLGFWFALILTAVGMAIFGILAQAIVYQPLKDAHGRTVMLSTVALSIALTNISVLIWGSVPLAAEGIFGQKSFHIGDVAILYQYPFVIICVVVLLLIQHVFLNKTTLGKCMRAVAQDRLAAELMGINSSRVIAITFAYSSALAGIAGVLLTPLFLASQAMANVGTKAFVACVIGGFGDVAGALVGGIFVGLVEVLSAGYISSIYKDAIVFIVLILFLLFKPQGILGRGTGQSL